MSNISELRQQLEQCERRLSVVESILVDLVEKSKVNVNDLSGELHEVTNPRSPIGFRTTQEK